MTSFLVLPFHERVSSLHPHKNYHLVAAAIIIEQPINSSDTDSNDGVNNPGMLDASIAQLLSSATEDDGLEEEE